MCNRFEITIKTDAPIIVIGGKLTGDADFQDEADGCVLIGIYIDGDVTLVAGSDNNNLIGCTITGSVLD